MKPITKKSPNMHTEYAVKILLLPQFLSILLLLYVIDFLLISFTSNTTNILPTGRTVMEFSL